MRLAQLSPRGVFRRELLDLVLEGARHAALACRKQGLVGFLELREVACGVLGLRLRHVLVVRLD
eukprot:9785723-Alexandrium_andersonii.AAC.1